MKWKAIHGIIGGFLIFSGLAETIYQLINWDSDYFELAKSIIWVLFGISLVTEWRKKRDGELMTDAEEKQVWEEFQGKVEEDEDGAS